VKSARWIATEVTLAVISTTIGWFLPDGLNALARLAGQSTLTLNPIERLLSAMVIFLFTVTLQLLLFVRSEIQDLRKDIPNVIEGALAEKAGSALDYSLLRVLLNGLDTKPESLLHVRTLLRSVSTALSNAHPDTRQAHTLMLERAITAAALEVNKLGTSGLEADLMNHLEVTRRLTEDARTYVQIQRRVFMVPDEWTQEWLRIVRTLSEQKTSCTYIVVIDRSELIKERKRTESMNRFLSRQGWQFKFCDLRDVLDTFGGQLPTDWNVELIDDKVIKLHEIPSGRYQGGTMLKMLLFSFDPRSDLGRYITYVCKSAEKVSAATFSPNTK
jgi:hypothetical protein